MSLLECVSRAFGAAGYAGIAVSASAWAVGDVAGLPGVRARAGRWLAVSFGLLALSVVAGMAWDMAGGGTGGFYCGSNSEPSLT